MEWIVNFLFYIRCVTEINTKLYLYKLALYHLWELQREFDRVVPVQLLGIIKSLLGLWTQIIHTEYTILLLGEKVRHGGTPFSTCDCAICISPQQPQYRPEDFWQAWENVFVQRCPCATCVYGRTQFLSQPGHPPYPHAYVPDMTYQFRVPVVPQKRDETSEINSAGTSSGGAFGPPESHASQVDRNPALCPNPDNLAQVQEGGPINQRQTEEILGHAVTQPFIAQLEPIDNMGPYATYQQL